MTKPNHDTIGTLAGRVNGAGSALTGLHMGFIEMTPEAIDTIVWVLRDVADKLEEIQKGGTNDANP